MHQTLLQDKFEDAGLKHDINIFKFQSKNAQIKHILVPNLRNFILHQTLQSDKFEGVNFKYDNGFFEV